MTLWRASGFGHSADDIGKGLDDHVHGPVAAGVDAHIPAVLLGGAEIAAQLLRVEPVVVAHLGLALKRLVHVGRVRTGAAVDGHLQPAQPQPLIAETGAEPGLRGAIVELLLALLLAEAVPTQHHVDAHRELAACIGGLIGPHLEGHQPRIDDAGDAVAVHLFAAKADGLDQFGLASDGASDRARRAWLRHAECRWVGRRHHARCVPPSGSDVDASTPASRSATLLTTSMLKKRMSRTGC